MKNYSQTNEAKKAYTSPLLTYALGVMENDPGHVFTKENLMAALGYSDRRVRLEIAKMGNYVPVISLSSRKGYRFGNYTDDSDVQYLTNLFQESCHAIAEIRSRITELNARLKPLIALKESLKSRLVKESGFEDALKELESFDFESEE